jgi:esterase/lipase superfamily enzyme
MLLTRRALAALFGSAAVMAGCGTRGRVAVVAEPGAADRTVQQVIVASSRQTVEAPVFFSSDRSFTAQFARFDVSIPPDREPGTIRYPRAEPDPRRDFVVVDAETLDGEAAFVAAVNAAARQQDPVATTGIVFVHGFNTNFAEALMKDAQIRHDLNFPGVGILFTWPSEAKLVKYVADREHALFSRDALAETLTLMRRTRLQGYTVFAHSMGTFLAMETLRALALQGDHATLRKISSVVLVSADLEIDLFRKQAGPVLAAGIPIYLLVSDNDRALRLSALIRGEQDRVGDVRSAEELGGLDVSIVDLSAVKSDDSVGHFKIETSKELIALFGQIESSGLSIFDDGQKVGVLDGGVAVLRGAAGLVLEPL